MREYFFVKCEMCIFGERSRRKLNACLETNKYKTLWIELHIQYTFFFFALKVLILWI